MKGIICFAKDPSCIGYYVTAMQPIHSMCQAHAKALGWSHYTIDFDKARNLYLISEF